MAIFMPFEQRPTLGQAALKYYTLDFTEIIQFQFSLLEIKSQINADSDYKS